MAAMVVCPEPQAAAIGGAILARGGNAVDAAVATAFAQGVANPLLCGLSGTAILMHRDRHGGLTVLNGECAIGSGPVPASWVAGLKGRSEMIGRFIVDGEDNQAGAGSVMVPGFVAAAADLHRRHGSGRCPWAELIEPSIRLARDGFEVYPYIADAWALDADGQAGSRPGYPSLSAKLARDADARAIYLKDGHLPYRVGDRLIQKAYGDSLDQLASAGADDFYSGAIARPMAWGCC
jgi:gamma-glutamyltranspeptidase/glutathione hydrolase